MTQKTYFIDRAFLSHGWTKDVRLSVDTHGFISSLQENVLAQEKDQRHRATFTKRRTSSSYQRQKTRGFEGIKEGYKVKE